jgi:hypothetical protein
MEGGAPGVSYRRRIFLQRVSRRSCCKLWQLRSAYKPTTFPLFDDAAADRALSASELHRMSVAYGLTFDAESIDRILSPQQIDDAPAFYPMVDVRRERSDRDELYPKLRHSFRI